MDQHQQSLLGRLRSLIPQRSFVSFDESLRIAELQAARLVESACGPQNIDEAHLQQLRRFRVIHERIAVSGMTHWTGTHWLITLNTADSPARRRFTLLHEYKHIVDHGSATRLYTGTSRTTAAEQAERAADYFAGCALVPKRELKAAWARGVQQPRDLAVLFGVSTQAIVVRLRQTKLDAPSDPSFDERCARPVATPRAHSQQFRLARSRRTFA